MIHSLELRKRLKAHSGYNQSAKKFCGHFCTHLLFCIVVLAFIIPISLVVYNSPPTKYVSKGIDFVGPPFDPRNISVFDESFGDYNVLLDPHSHSTVSDGGYSPEDNIVWHIKNGYNAMVLTDHNKIRGGLEGAKIAKEKYSKQIVVIPGIEWTNCRCHMGLLGIKQDVKLYKFPTNAQIKETIDKVHSLGGVVVLNHYPWSTHAGLDQPSFEEWRDMGVDFIEVVNDNTLDYLGITFAKKNNIRYLTGTDMHRSSPASVWTVLNVPDPLGQYSPESNITAAHLSEEKIMHALRTQSTKTSFIFDAIGSKITASHKTQTTSTYKFMSPWIYMGGYFHSFYELRKGMYSFVEGSCTPQKVVIHSAEIVSLITWTLGLFLGFELLYVLFRLLFSGIRRHNIRPVTFGGDDSGSASSPFVIDYDDYPQESGYMAPATGNISKMLDGSPINQNGSAEDSYLAKMYPVDGK
eukprot:gene16670-19811_t